MKTSLWWGYYCRGWCGRNTCRRQRIRYRQSRAALHRPSTLFRAFMFTVWRPVQRLRLWSFIRRSRSLQHDYRRLQLLQAKSGACSSFQTLFWRGGTAIYVWSPCGAYATKRTSDCWVRWQASRLTALYAAHLSIPLVAKIGQPLKIHSLIDTPGPLVAVNGARSS